MGIILNAAFSGSVMFGSAMLKTFSVRFRMSEDELVSSWMNPVETQKREKLEGKVDELAKKLGITKEISVKVNREGGFAQAHGMALFPFKAGITVDSKLLEEIAGTDENKITENELEFILAHELSHIKANDSLTMGVVPGIIGVVTTIALSILFPPLVVAAPFISVSIAGLIGFAVSGIALVLFSRWREKRADMLAMSICSDDVKKAGVSLSEKMRKWGLTYRNREDVSCISRAWRKFTVNKEGENRLDIFHPSLKKRIEYLKKAAGQVQN